MSSTRRIMGKMIDIGANLTDPMFRGIYHGSRKHDDDFSDMMNRAKDNGVEKIIVTGGSLEDSKAALELAQTYENLYSTVGCHPTRCKEFVDHPGGPAKYLSDLEELIRSDKVVAIGELGLDNDRLQFCDAQTQRTYFELQLELASKYKLPLFLHNRNSIDNMVEILERNAQKFQASGGVVHSFDGTADDVSRILNLGLSIGINGCSLKKEENLEVIKCIPSDKLMIETDCPWCEIRQTHAGYKFIKSALNKSKNAKDPKLAVKNRNEPMNLVQVLEVLAAVRQEEQEILSNQIYLNTMRMFFNK
uniref:Deoxyribonuclease TATDN1 n=1 Tax=Aceria tosichella TaxID=561515 RepID=A0A6G1SFW6_9ACAR